MKRLVMVMMGVGLLMAGGCVTMVDQNTMAQQQADVERMREDVQRLHEKLNGIELEQQNLTRDIGAVRGSSKEDVVIRNRLDTLERQVQSLAAGRESDRKEIVNKVANLVGSSSGGGTSAGHSSSSHSSAGSSQTGYEHVVESGQSLSAIAAAYKVSMTSIKKANNLKSNTLRVGQKLFIPKN
ncbi:MAG: LysM peptidoglycan-binding domain-containing protein [bacterium]